MPYVQRDASGAICGCFTGKQPGFAEEFLADTDPQVIAFLKPPIAPVTQKQARLALFGAGLLDEVNAAVTAAGGATLIEWNYADTVNRNDVLIVTLGQALGLTPAQIDALFVTASTL